MQNKKVALATLVVSILLSVATSVAAANRSSSSNYYYYDNYSYNSYNYDSWFDLSQLNAIGCGSNLKAPATREEVGLIISLFAEELGKLPTSSEIQFVDRSEFSSSQIYKKLERLTTTGVVSGYPGNIFKPERSITRAEMCRIVSTVINSFQLETVYNRKTSGSLLYDISAHWAEDYIVDCYKWGLIAGYPDGNFYPDNNISRQEFLQILIGLLVVESQNPIITAVDQVYNLQFDNSYGRDVDDYYYNSRNSSKYSNSRYYDYADDYYYNNRYNNYSDSTTRPVVSTGSSANSSYSSGNTSSSIRPERPAVEVDTTTTTTTSIGDGSSRPSRPTVEVDTTSTSRSVSDASSVSAERPVVEVDTDTTVAAGSEPPVRPSV